MSTQDMDILARKIVSLEKRHNSLARAQQLPNSSVRIVDGDDVGLSDAVESVKDTSDEAAYLGEWLYDADDNIDNEAEHSVEIPDWIQGAGHVGDVAWDSTQFATDLALQLETELGEAQQELEQAQIELAQALADSAAALQEAQEALQEAEDATTAAGNAQTSADGKNTIWFQNDAPAGTAHKVGDTWFDTNDGNRMYRWNGSNWATAQFGTNAITDTAINAAKLANNAVTEGKILNGAITNDKLNSAVQNAITTAQSTATNAQTVATNAQSVANAAQTAASSAQDDADQAIADALAAANAASTADGKAVAARNTANAKGKVIIQSAAPAAADRLPQNLWIDTTGGANTPKRWVSGTTWAVVTDKAATDAAAAAVTAQNAANAAQSRADDAHTIASGAATAASAAASAASAAQTAANNAQTTANGKNKIVRSTADASSPGNYVAGDQWWKYNGSQITAMWIHSGTAWVSQTLTDSVITNLNAGSITAGTIASARLSATNIKAVLINAGAIETANIAAGAITAASGIIADAAIGTAKIIDGSITTAKIANLAVTNAEIADGTIQNAKIANLDAAKISTGTLNAARIASGAIVADKLASNAVTAIKINAGAVTTEKINTGAVNADKIASNAVTAEKIAANAVTAGKIQAQAIDGMTITGALIRTAASGQRMQFDVNGINAYDSNNRLTAVLRSADGGIVIGGIDTNGYNTFQLSLVNNGITIYDPVSPGAGNTSIGVGSIGLNISATASIGNSSASGAFQLFAGSSPSSGAAIVLTPGTFDPSGNSTITLNAHNINYRGDTGWATLTGLSQGFSQTSSPVMYRIKNNYVEFKGSLSNNTFSGVLTKIASLPTAFRPTTTSFFSSPSNFGTAVNRAIRIYPNGDLEVTSSAASGAWWSFDSVRYPID